jgi:hypothetical protein
MPCSVSQAEIDAYAEMYRRDNVDKGRWDRLATKEQLAGWLCDALNNRELSPECKRWFAAHKLHNDKAGIR